MTLDYFVKDGVVKCWDRARRVESEEGYVVLLVDGGMVAEDVGHRVRVDLNLTPTQLRALSAMCLWAAEQVEKKPSTT